MDIGVAVSMEKGYCQMYQVSGQILGCESGDRFYQADEKDVGIGLKSGFIKDCFFWKW